MTTTRRLPTIAAMLLMVMAIAPAVTASQGEPVRGAGAATFIGTGWAYDFDGDLDCAGFAEVPDVRIVGEIPFVEGTMHWFEIMTLDCGDGTMTLENYGTWTFDNGKFRANGTVVAATGTYEYLIGASAHQQGLVDPAIFPFAGTVSLRIN
jgi:hypothetical protein